VATDCSLPILLVLSMATGGVEIRVLVEVVEDFRRVDVIVVLDVEEVEGRLGRSDVVGVLVRVKMQREVDGLVEVMK